MLVFIMAKGSCSARHVAETIEVVPLLCYQGWANTGAMTVGQHVTWPALEEHSSEVAALAARPHLVWGTCPPQVQGICLPQAWGNRAQEH